MIDTYAENHASETGTIGDHVTIINTGTIKNVRIGQELTVALFGGVLKVAVTGIQPVLNEKHTTENG